MGGCRILLSDFDVDAICISILSSPHSVKSTIIGEISVYNYYVIWQTKNSVS